MTSPNQLSFLPDDYLERKARRRANILCGVLSVVVMGGIGSAFTLTEQSMRRVEQRHAEVDKTFGDAARRIEQVNVMRAQQRSIVEHAELAAALVEKVPRSNLLAEFTNSLPAGMSLLELTMESRARAAPVPDANKSSFEQKRDALEGLKGSAPQPKLYDVYLKLTGIADTDVQVAQFITRLNGSKLLRDVNLVISDIYEHDHVTMRKFQIEMMLNPDAEVKDEPAPTKTAAVELK